MPDSLLGQTISHYRIIAKLGSGGMGEVYKAEDARLGRMVALKFLSDDLRKDALALDRFEREARTISGLNHPGICVLHDIGEQDGQRFLVMELLEGQTLRDCVGDRPLANDVLVDLAIQIADALDAAHSRGIVHRDQPAFFASVGTGSSPSWSPDGKRIAVGFLQNGMFGSALSEMVNVSDGKQTPMGNTRWTELRQMAWLPDGSGVLTEGSPVDNPSGSNSQIWEIQYPSGELRRITNDLNYYADASMTADGSKLVTIQAAFHSSLWLMPADVSKSASASPHEIGQDFGNAQGFLGTAWTPKGDILSGYYNSGQKGLTRISPASGDAENLNVNVGISIGPSSCGNSSYFVFMTKQGLMRANPDGGDLKQLTSDTEDISPACSPDGKVVFYNHVADSQTRLWRVGADGQGATKFADKSYILPAVSPDGKRVVVLDFADFAKLMLVILDARSGDVQSSYQVHGNSFFVNEGEARMAWTPDSHGIVYIVGDPVSNVSNLWEQPISDSGTKQEPPKQITNFTSLEIWSIAFSPDGKQLLLARGRSTTDAVMLSHFY